MVSNEALERWRHLLEPELSSCVMPVRWDDLLLLDRGLMRLYEGASSVLVTLDMELGGEVVRTVLCAAGELGEITAMFDRIVSDGRADGIRRALWMGRPGWLRVAPGWSVRAVVAERILE